MSSIWDWSTTAASNANADSDINFAEGQAPSTVNDSARQVMARIAEWLHDLGGSEAAGGTANALTLTTASAFTALGDGLIVGFVAASDNTAAATLNANGTGAKSIRKITASGEAALVGGEIQGGGIYIARYLSAANGSAGGWILQNNTIDIVTELGYTPLDSAGGTVDGDLVVTGTSDLQGNVTAGGDLDITGDTSVGGNLDVTGTITGYVPTSRTVTGGGLATGGGDLSANRTITVTEASQSEATAGTSSTVVMTPRRVKNAIDGSVYTGSSAAETDFPIGHTVYFGTVNDYPRNGAITLRLQTSTNSAYVDSGSGSILAGTWRVRGLIDNRGIAQRVA